MSIQFKKAAFLVSREGKNHVIGILLFFYQWGRFVQPKHSVNILVHRTDILLDSIDVLFVVIFVGGKTSCQTPQGGRTQD
jgi:hypothetical protein